MADPKLRLVQATVQHEKFYHDIMSSAATNGLSDGEAVAILALVLGRFIGGSNPGLDRTTLQDTALHNITKGAGEIKGMLEALKGGPN